MWRKCVQRMEKNLTSKRGSKELQGKALSFSLRCLQLMDVVTWNVSCTNRGEYHSTASDTSSVVLRSFSAMWVFTALQAHPHLWRVSLLYVVYCSSWTRIKIFDWQNMCLNLIVHFWSSWSLKFQCFTLGQTAAACSWSLQFGGHLDPLEKGRWCLHSILILVVNALTWDI